MVKVLNFNEYNKKNKLYSEKIKQFKFALHKHTMVDENGLLRDYWFIVIKDRITNVTLEFTHYSKFLRHTIKNIDIRRSETIRKKGTYICMFLNYILIDNYEKFKIDDIRNIKIEHGNRFLKTYAEGEIGLKKKTLEGNLVGKQKTLDTVLDVMDILTEFYVYIQNTYKEEARYINNKIIKKSKKETYSNSSTLQTKYEIPFNISGEFINKDNIFRDMPDKVFWIVLNLAKEHYPELRFAIALQAFAGLRSGEICNVRQAICPIGGGGVFYRKQGSKLLYFEIDIRRKYPMRSDLKDTGGIKKRRKQHVYDKYLNILKELYEEHMKILSNYNLEEGYYPMFVNRDGKAITVDSYQNKISRLLNKILLESIIDAEDAELRTYAQILTQRKLSSHCFRHWFTVMLVKEGLTPHEIAMYRGDNNLDTAIIYCRQKEELLKAIKDSNEKTIGDILFEGNGRYED